MLEMFGIVYIDFTSVMLCPSITGERGIKICTSQTLQIFLCHFLQTLCRTSLVTAELVKEPITNFCKHFQLQRALIHIRFVIGFFNLVIDSVQFNLFTVIITEFSICFCKLSVYCSTMSKEHIDCVRRRYILCIDCSTRICFLQRLLCHLRNRFFAGQEFFHFKILFCQCL